LLDFWVMLSAAKVAEFFDVGYLLLPGLFDAAELEAARAAFGRLEERARSLPGPEVVNGALFVVHRPKPEEFQIERIVWCGAVEAPLAELGRAEKLVTPVAELLGGPELDHIINQAHLKRPGDGVEFHYHQDSYHRRYGTQLFTDVNGRGSFVQALTAIDDMGAENGGLWLVPRSNHLGHIPTADGRLPEGAFRREDARPLELRAGDTLLLGPFTVHGSGPNRGATPRRLFINGFCCPGANRREYPGAGTGFRLRAWGNAA
jgi:ectoine hydroxylase-related dioxygenase (phytanoyl-CoA dioxygenase family)